MEEESFSFHLIGFDACLLMCWGVLVLKSLGLVMNRMNRIHGGHDNATVAKVALPNSTYSSS